MRVKVPEDLIERLQSRAAEEGREIDATVADVLRLGLANASSGTADHLMLERRKSIAEKFLSGEWGVDLEGFSEGRAADRASAADRDQAWRR